MEKGATGFFGRRDQVAVALIFLTRLPIRLAGAVPGDAVARAAWAFPLVGMLVGALAALAAALADRLNMPPGIVALAALGAAMLLTGALHEDGLADTADGFGGGASVQRKLEIMRDSRIGTYGVLALGIAIGLRAVALDGLAGHGMRGLFGALVAAHALSRGFLPFAMRRLPAARPEGLAASVGIPGPDAARLALAIALLAAWLGLGLGLGFKAALAAALAMLVVGLLARRQIGGYTGDVLGAMQQAGETAVLMAVVAAGGG